MRHGAVGLIAAAFSTISCSGGSSEASDRAIERAEYQLEDATFEDVGDTGQCTEDCSGHEAGFEWARNHGLTDPSECGGRSDSFIEGCEAYTQALEDAAGDGADEYEDDF